MKGNETKPNSKDHHAQHVYAIMLIPGDWKKLFLHDQFHNLIAECLNLCVYEDDMIINGYLITYEKIWLILDDGYEAPKKLVIFSEKIKKAFLKQRRHPHDEDEDTEITLYHLFRKFPLYDNALTMLITGREVSIPYYNPDIKRLKDKIKKEYYSSFIDYTGAKGPVKVKLLSRDTKICIVNVESISVKDEYLFE